MSYQFYQPFVLFNDGDSPFVPVVLYCTESVSGEKADDDKMRFPFKKKGDVEARVVQMLEDVEISETKKVNRGDNSFVGFFGRFGLDKSDTPSMVLQLHGLSRDSRFNGNFATTQERLIIDNYVSLNPRDFRKDASHVGILLNELRYRDENPQLSAYLRGSETGQRPKIPTTLRAPELIV